MDLFTADAPVVFAFHGYQRAIHQLIHGRANAERFHVRGFNEQGTTTTPFDMVVLNGMSRYHLGDRRDEQRHRLRSRTPGLIDECRTLIPARRGLLPRALRGHARDTRLGVDRGESQGGRVSFEF